MYAQTEVDAKDVLHPLFGNNAKWKFSSNYGSVNVFGGVKCKNCCF